MSGGAGDDDLIGGSSVAGTPDGCDNISGDDGNDVIAGDNAVITRTVIAGNLYKRYTAGSPSGTGLGLENNAVVRTVTLLDRDTIGAADVINGGNNDDTAFGGLGNDTVNGNDGDDDLTGNFGADRINGGSGDDGIVGDNGTIVDDLLAGPGRTLAAPGNKLRR